MRSIGDLASLMISSRQHGTLQLNAMNSAQTAATGVAQDKAQHLGGKTSHFSLLDRKIELLQQYQKNASEAKISASTIQIVLEKVNNSSSEFSNKITLSSQIDNTFQLEIFSSQGAKAFYDVVSAVNTRVSGKYVFSGLDITTKPLPNGTTILEKLKDDLSGLANAVSISDAVDDWFDNPTGPYQALIYRGSAGGSVEFPVDIDTTVLVSNRANSPVIINTLKALAKSAIAAEEGFNLTTAEQKYLFDQSKDLLSNSENQLTKEQALVGVTETIIDKAAKENSESLQLFKRERLSMVEIDQFTSITDFEALQQKLDISYQLAARQSKTSLAEYLR